MSLPKPVRTAPPQDTARVAPKDLPPSAPVAENRRARYDYHIEERYEAGICLMAGRSRPYAPARCN